MLKKNVALKTVTDLRLFSRFKSIWICTGSKEAKNVNTLAAEKFPKDTWWDHYLPDFQCSQHWSKFGGSGKRCWREWVLARGRKGYSKIYMKVLAQIFVWMEIYLREAEYVSELNLFMCIWTSVLETCSHNKK